MYNQNFLVNQGGQRQPAKDLLEQFEDLLSMELRGHKPTTLQSGAGKPWAHAAILASGW